MPKSNCSRTPFGSERVHRSQKLHKSAWQHFYTNFPLIQEKLSWKKSLWIRSKILRLSVSTLTADNMYSLQNWKKLPQQIQTQLSEKRKIISGIFIAFLKSTWNFLCLDKKDQLDKLNFSEVIDSQKCCYLYAKKQLFQNTFRQWMCLRVMNTAQICMAALLF